MNPFRRAKSTGGQAARATQPLRELAGQPIDRLLENRYAKFRNIGVFFEGEPSAV